MLESAQFEVEIDNRITTWNHPGEEDIPEIIRITIPVFRVGECSKSGCINS